jgi:hypothetical protein
VRDAPGAPEVGPVRLVHEFGRLVSNASVRAPIRVAHLAKRDSRVPSGPAVQETPVEVHRTRCPMGRVGPKNRIRVPSDDRTG